MALFDRNRWHHHSEIAINYRVYEFKSYKELLREIKKDTENKEKNFGSRWILSMNWLSNAYGVNYWKGARFTVFSAILFLSFTILTTVTFWGQWCWCSIDWSFMPEAIKYFVTFLNPLHSLTYLDELKTFYGVSYIFDFLGRIVVGYGIYQTVQAFRKYK